MNACRLSISCAFLGLLAACGGGSGGGGGALVSTPTPTPSPIPTPTPTPPPTAALIAPHYDADASSIFATSTADSFSGTSARPDVPLFYTAVTGNFSGYSESILESHSLSADGTTPTIDSFTPAGTSLVVSSKADILDYTRYGDWYYNPNDANQNFGGAGVLVGGYQTLTVNMPASGTASYSGKTDVIWSGYPGTGQVIDYAFGLGNVSMTANFGTGAVSGSMTGITLNDNLFVGPMNDLSFSALIASNGFSGSIVTGPMSPNKYGLTPGVSGTMKGLFFGPSAQEAGGAFILTDDRRRVIGSFGVKQ